MKAVDPVEFSQAWISAWNRRDVEAVLSHFHDGAVFASPVAQRIGFSAEGRVRGKFALREYWTQALSKNPDLRFTLTGVFKGIDLLVIAFVDQEGRPRTEVLRFEDGLVVEGYGTIAA